jgi:monoamine oxidase
MDRRQVLQTLAASLAAFTGSRCSGEDETPVVIPEGPQCEDPSAGGGRRIAVIGAGMAGLTAAHALTRCGFTVTVLESRGEVGGRVRTIDTFPQPVDLGASWIHGGSGNPLGALLTTDVLETDPDAVILYEAGQRLSDAEMERTYADVDRVGGAFERIDEESERDMPVSRAIELARAQRAPALDWALNSEIAIEYATDLDALSFWWGTDDAEFEGEEWLLVGGMREFLRAFDADWSLRTDTRVTSITDQGARVRVQADGFDELFDAAICTVSCALLQQQAITFSPGLSERQQLALQRIQMGTLDKTFLQFDRQFWPTASVLGFVGAQLDGIGEFYDLSAQAGAPVLMGFASGTIARTLGGLPDEERVARAMATLRTAFPDAPDPVVTHLSNWSQDPDTGGSYSSLAVGGVPEDFLAMESPVGERIFLAGEHTNRDFRGTLHGAHFSGLRAAAQVVRLLQG